MIKEKSFHQGETMTRLHGILGAILAASIFTFVAVADPLLDKLSKDLGPHAEKIKNLIRAIN
jgi:hypothetical protein